MTEKQSNINAGHGYGRGYDLEELLDDAQECYRRYQAGHLYIIEQALRGGENLTKARPLVNHGDWGHQLEIRGIPPRTATAWMTLYGLGLTAEEIQEQGGIRRVLEANRVRKHTPAQAVQVAQARYDPSYDEIGTLMARMNALRREQRDALKAGATPRPSKKQAKSATVADLANLKGGKE